MKHNFMLLWCIKSLKNYLFNNSVIACFQLVLLLQIKLLYHCFQSPNKQTSFSCTVASQLTKHLTRSPIKPILVTRLYKGCCAQSWQLLKLRGKCPLGWGEVVRIQQESKTSIQTTVFDDMSASNAKHCTQLFKGW